MTNLVSCIWVKNKRLIEINADVFSKYLRLLKSQSQRLLLIHFYTNINFIFQESSMEFTLLWVNRVVQCDKWTGTMQDCRRTPAEGPTRPAVTLPTVTAVKKRPSRLIQFKLVNLLIRPTLVLQIRRQHILPWTGYPRADTAGCSGQPQLLRCLFNNNNNNNSHRSGGISTTLSNPRVTLYPGPSHRMVLPSR